MTAMKKKRKAKPYEKYDDVERAQLFGAYCDNDGDIDATYKALARKVTKTALNALEEDFKWPVLYEEVRNRFMKAALDQSAERKKQTLKMLHNAKVQAYNSIVGDKQNNISPARAKSLGEAIESLVRVIEKESDLLGDAPADEPTEDASTGLLKWVLERYMKEREKADDAKQGTEDRARALGISVEVGTREQ